MAMSAGPAHEESPADAAPASLLGGWSQHVRGARGLAVNGGALIVNVLTSGLTGLGFWVFAARVAPPHSVGEASTAISAVIAVVSLAQQSFVLTLPSLLAGSPRPRALTVSMYRAALAMTALAAPLYVLLGPVFADGLGFLREPRVAIGFVIATMVWCLFSLQDAVLTGVRKAPYVLIENTTWGCIRLAILVIAWAAGVRLGIAFLLASWILPALACVAVVSWYLFAYERSPLREAKGSRTIERRRFLSYMGAEYLSSALGSIVTLVTGAYALTTLGASAAAPLLIAASLVVVVEGALSSFAQALSVEASRDGAAHRRRGLLGMTAIVLGGLSLAAIIGARLVGEQVMALLGPHYREAGGTALAILMLAVPARALGLVSNADNRIRGEGSRNLLQQAVACVVCFGLLASGRFTTLPALAWVMVIMRYSTAVVAGLHLSRGRLHLGS
jgi:O-antigen/teichoic acid export membrane protein